MDTVAVKSSWARRWVLIAIGALGVSAVMTQLAMMREMLGAFAGNEMVLGILLGNWLLLTGLGSSIGRTSIRLRNPYGMLVWVLMLVAILPLVQVFAVRALRHLVFPRGAMVGVTETVVGGFVLLAPYCLVSGYLLALACALIGRRQGLLDMPAADRSAGSAAVRSMVPAGMPDDADGLGRVYVADSLGSVAGGLFFGFVCVRLGDHLGILCVPALMHLALAAVIASRCGRGTLPGIAALAVAAGVVAVAVLDMDAFSTGMQYPGRRIVFRGNSPYGKLLVTESAGQYDFIENGVPLFSTQDPARIEETVHYAMVQRPGARKVLLVAGGVAGTAREILKYHGAEVTYVELDPLVIEAGRRLLADNLTDPRIRVVTTDGRMYIKRTRERYDVVIVDMPDPSTSRINRYYTAEFFSEVRRVLAADGVLSFALGGYENYMSPALARMLASAWRSLQPSFRNLLMLPGGRIHFLASDGILHADIAARIEEYRIPTRLVRRSYLDAMLTPDRMADVRRAVSQPAAANTDFHPVLYYYHLLYWIGQYKVSFGVLEVVLLAVFAIYLLRMRAVPLAIFVSGFAASALEVVLLLGFQILHGSLYQQLAVIVTMFMAGLAAGAWLALRPRAADRADDGRDQAGRWRARRGLARLAFAIAGYAALLPLALMMFAHWGGAGGSMWVVSWGIPLLTFLLAVLAGMEFPLAGRADSAGGAVASRLYTADFMGAFLGALLASTLLIPVFGVMAVCLLTAGLNVLGGIAVLWHGR